MPRPIIPQRQPISDSFSGVLIQIENATKTQSWGLLASQEPDKASYRTGEFIIRYGVRYMGKPHISIIPGIVASDYGDMMTGEMAWEFIYKKGLNFPRTEVIGYRNDGTDEMIAMKYLDPAILPQVLIYADGNATIPITPIVALIAPLEVAKTMPPRLLEYLPRFDNLEDWKTE